MEERPGGEGEVPPHRGRLRARRRGVRPLLRADSGQGVRPEGSAARGRRPLPPAPPGREEGAAGHGGTAPRRRPLLLPLPAGEGREPPQPLPGAAPAAGGQGGAPLPVGAGATAAPAGGIRLGEPPPQGSGDDARLHGAAGRGAGGAVHGGPVPERAKRKGDSEGEGRPPPAGPPFGGAAGPSGLPGAEGKCPVAAPVRGPAGPPHAGGGCGR